jgi:hypothetical protein
MKKFKKALAILLMLSTMASFTGCISKEQPEASDATHVTYQIGSPGKAEDFEFGVTGINSFELTTEYGETFHCLLVSVTYTNLSEKEQDITKRNIEFYLDNEEIKPCEYRSEFEPFFDEGNLFNDNNINPGRTKRGYIVYRIYKDYSKIDVVLNGITVSSSRDAVKPLALPTPTETAQMTKETNND